jgi:hypothetical protein
VLIQVINELVLRLDLTNKLTNPIPNEQEYWEVEIILQKILKLTHINILKLWS